MNRDDGGPAFLTTSQVSQNEATGEVTSHLYLSDGVTLRDYFIAHAPAEPQPWFQPVMPPKPSLPCITELSDEDAKGWRAERPEFAPERCSPELLDFAERMQKSMNACADWDREQQRQRYIQWPAAWADAMLEARK